MFKSKRFKNGLLFTTLLTLLIINSIPIVLVIINSFRTNAEIKIALFGLPKQLNFANYITVFKTAKYLRSYIINFTVGFATIVIVVILILFASYGIVKLKGYGSRFFTGYFTASLSIPAFSIMVPLFFIFNKLGLVKTIPGIILIFVAISIPFNFLFMRAFLIGMPSEIEEAARIDGASELQIVRYIILPLAKPIILTVAIIIFTTTWNEFLIPNIFLSGSGYRMVSQNFYLFSGEYNTNLAYVFTAAVFTIMPIVVLYLLFQKSFVEGMTKGGIKG